MNYIEAVKQNIKKINNAQIINVVERIKKLNKKNKIILAGNGASASISSHLAIDFTKAANIRAVNFNESSLLTCFSNDFGYENWIVKALEFYMLPGDIVILISSSGKSNNIVNAGKFLKNKNYFITLTGINKKNILSNLGDVNFFVNSKNYNVVESVHLVILLSIIEKLIEKS